MRTDLVLQKIRRIAAASFKNAVRLHVDAVLLFSEERIPSAVHMSVLSIEELGKYFIHEDIWYHNLVDGNWSLPEIESWIQSAFSHTSKQQWFAGQALPPFVSRPLWNMLASGELENLKQRATYVGLPRRGRKVDFSRRFTSPSNASRVLAEKLITMVNDYLIHLAVGVRKGFYSLDIPEIDSLLEDPEFEAHFVDLWPLMRASTKRHINRMRQDHGEDR